MSTRNAVTTRVAGRPRTAVVVVCVAVGWLAAAGLTHAQLVNPGFEDAGGSLVGWYAFGNVAGNVTVASTTPRSGSWVARLSAAPGSVGGTTYSGIAQGLATHRGAVWTATAHARHNSGSRLEGDNLAIMKIEFYRRFGGFYGTSDFLGESVITMLDSRETPDAWHERTLSFAAPADAVEARLVFVFITQGTDSGTALIDDVTFTASGGDVGPPDGLAWKLTWHDEFDGSTVDPSKWNVLDAHLIKNGELQYYDPEDVYVEGGCLVLRSRRHDPPVIRPHPNGHDAEFEFTSGLVESPGLFSHTYGWIEVRAKLPSTQGIWPAHWMLGESFPQVGWPRCGEIDMMESLGNDPTTVYFSRHWGDPYVHRGTSSSGPDFSQDFHTFAIHWTADAMSWYVDGSLRYRTSITDAGEIFHRPFYLILNTAVGGYWPGFPDDTTVFPQYHEIDYVRWYVESGPGDFDLDGDVDDVDRDVFADCFGGDGQRWTDPACRFFDLDADDDVDCHDWDRFTESWTSSPLSYPFLSQCRTPETRRPQGRRW